MSRQLMAGLVVAMTIASGPAFACKGVNVIFGDDFSVLDPGWGEADDILAVGSKTLLLKPEAGRSAGAVYSGELFENADICIDVVAPQARTPPNGGLVFWWDNWDNAYLLQFDLTGSASVFRWQRGKALFPVSWRKAPAVKTAPGAVNTLRVTLKGTAVSAYINDQLFATVKGSPPPGGGLIGVFGNSENGASNTWTFSNLRVTDVR